MCGRYTLAPPPGTISRLFDLGELPPLEPRYNIAPSQYIACIRRGQGSRREFCVVKWGLVPFWAKDKSIGHRLINARSETAASKPAFRAAMRYRRCLLPANGFYEWKKTPKGKQPMYIQVKHGELFALGGLWESWESEEGEVIDSAVILTTRPNERVREIHDRMPVIIPADGYERWLDPEIQKFDQVSDLLEPFPAETMTVCPVSKKVNRPDFDLPECIEPVEVD